MPNDNQKELLSDRDYQPLGMQWMDLIKSGIAEGFQGPEYEQPATPQYSSEPAPSEEIVQTGIPFGPGALRSLMQLFKRGRKSPATRSPKRIEDEWISPEHELRQSKKFLAGTPQEKDKLLKGLQREMEEIGDFDRLMEKEHYGKFFDPIRRSTPFKYHTDPLASTLPSDVSRTLNPQTAFPLEIGTGAFENIPLKGNINLIKLAWLLAKEKI
jgi:hypothetical protein